MTDAEYNGVLFRNVDTEPINQRQVLDDAGEPLYVESVVRFNTVIHAEAANPSIGLDVSSPLAGGVAAVEQLLHTQRRRFRLWINGVLLFDVWPMAAEPGIATAPNLGQGDVNNGPRTQVQLTKITGGKSVHVQFTVTFCVPNCNAYNTGDGILSVKWWTTDDIHGDDMLTTRLVEGFVRLASKKVNAHAFRNFVLGPPLGRNFRFARASYAESPDGLTLRYRIEHDEWARLPPAPATHWRGRFRASTYKPGGFLWAGELTVTVKSPHNIGLNQLHGLCKKIMDAKLDLTNRLNNKSAFPEHYAIDESLTACEVTHSCRIRYQPQDGATAAGLNMPLADLGFKDIPGYNPAVANNPPPTASTKGILHAAIVAQCSHNEMGQSSAVELQTGSAPTVEDEPVVVDEGQLQPGDSAIDFQLQATNPLTMYAITSDYHIKTGRAALPIGKSSTGASRALVRLHRPTATRTVRINAERLDKWPQFPGQADFVDGNGIEHNVLDYKPMPNTGRLSADGKRLLMSGSLDITYGLSRAPTDADNMSVGKLPGLLGLSAEQTTLDAGELVSPESVLSSGSTLTAAP